MVSRTTSLLDSMHTTKTVASYSTATEILCERAEPEFRCRIGPCFRPGRQPAVEPAAPLSRHNPHDARSSGSGLGAAPRSEFALQRQPSVRQATLEHLATPMPFSTAYFRACASGSRTANNGVHQLSRARKIM